MENVLLQDQIRSINQSLTIFSRAAAQHVTFNDVNATT